MNYDILIASYILKLAMYVGGDRTKGDRAKRGEFIEELDSSFRSVELFILRKLRIIKHKRIIVTTVSDLKMQVGKH